MKITEKSELSESDKIQLIQLWNSEYPEKLIIKDLAHFENYLRTLEDQSHILVFDEDQYVKAWYFDFIRDGERWFAIIVDSQCQGRGLGSDLLNRAKERQNILNGWVIDNDSEIKKNGHPYFSPIDFYLKNDFKKLPGIRLELDKISAVKIRWVKFD
ncbi:GNAT family N-acetyltransferase [Mangrovivirga sp. M17]|uniref:GNAT family N-acetyltransferase n=1 Tax=Mangrovivirga halotolerans TaxID=2993936 RepID=A0ABT3RNY6_9BACT|nr:GNAT family N-acetyltransferase [Mangrovivirga halotolerans]MCX2743253.1 GNAT family N-acetyltransferase [Mangrovivirga halotolerans]